MVEAEAPECRPVPAEIVEAFDAWRERCARRGVPAVIPPPPNMAPLQMGRDYRTGLPMNCIECPHIEGRRCDARRYGKPIEGCLIRQMERTREREAAMKAEKAA